ncbi:hypothetical protein DE146DRAFT_647491 [Phaeosphaeria sp. MPI-PUGE-AT-0046c]|nr:hypothetical protein DE146DRAFT_647491 [Phaeosphaeria sp. MPI-PUGE-AT-0046c]
MALLSVDIFLISISLPSPSTCQTSVQAASTFSTTPTFLTTNQATPFLHAVTGCGIEVFAPTLLTPLFYFYSVLNDGARGHLGKELLWYIKSVIAQEVTIVTYCWTSEDNTRCDEGDDKSELHCGNEM